MFDIELSNIARITERVMGQPKRRLILTDGMHLTVVTVVRKKVLRMTVNTTYV